MTRLRAISAILFGGSAAALTLLQGATLSQSALAYLGTGLLFVLLSRRRRRSGTNQERIHAERGAVPSDFALGISTPRQAQPRDVVPEATG